MKYRIKTISRVNGQNSFYPQYKKWWYLFWSYFMTGYSGYPIECSSFYDAEIWIKDMQQTNIKSIKYTEIKNANNL